MDKIERYKRLSQMGLSAQRNKAPDVKTRFWNLVTIGKPDECWVWKTPVKSRYPIFTINRRSFAANRLCWELTYGEIPVGFHVLHKCDNTRCVNPNHLFLGTHRDNMDDMTRKKRYFDCTGLKFGMKSKFGLETVREIKRRHKPYTCTAKQLAKEFGLKYMTVRAIIYGPTYAHYHVNQRSHVPT